MKAAYIAALFILAATLACEASANGTPDPVQQFNAALTGAVSATPKAPRATPSRAPLPTATVGYAATINAKDQQLVSAQSTRDALARLQSDVTLEAGHMTEQAGQWTQEAFSAREQHVHETQTAATPARVATQTRQAADDKKTFAIANAANGQLTAIAEAPTKAAAMLQATLDAEYKPTERAVGVGLNVAAMIFLSVSAPFMIVAFIWLRRWLFMHPVQDEEPEEIEQSAPIPAPLPKPAFSRPSNVTVETFSHETDGYAVVMAEEWPCTERQFDELMRHIAEHHGEIIVRRFQGSESAWTRKAFDKWREWAGFHNPMYVLERDGRLGALQALKNIAYRYAETNILPSKLSFRPEEGDLLVSVRHTREREGVSTAEGEGMEPNYHPIAGQD